MFVQFTSIKGFFDMHNTTFRSYVKNMVSNNKLLYIVFTIFILFCMCSN